MKLFNHWPSRYYWSLRFDASLAYVNRYKDNQMAVNHEIQTRWKARRVQADFPEEGILNLNLLVEFYSLRNDEKLFKVFSFLKESFGLFSFEAELTANSVNEVWDAYIASYSYAPSMSPGIQRVYLSYSECEALCHFQYPDEICTTTMSILHLRSLDNLQVGGSVFINFNNQAIENKARKSSTPGFAS